MTCMYVDTMIGCTEAANRNWTRADENKGFFKTLARLFNR